MGPINCVTPILGLPDKPKCMNNLPTLEIETRRGKLELKKILLFTRRRGVTGLADPSRFCPECTR